MPYESDEYPIRHLVLPENLRSQLSKPMGKLIPGSTTETLPRLKQMLEHRKSKLVGVGDVTAKLLVEEGFNPELIITDGKTKRRKLEEWERFPEYQEVLVKCPPAQITRAAWLEIRRAVSGMARNQKTHLMVDGEEDLLVLPVVLEAQIGTIVIYGQPNQGVVVRKVTTDAKKRVMAIFEQMENY